MKKRKDECFKCTSRSCYTKIIAYCYEEIACNKHLRDLEKESDLILGKGNGVQRIHQSSTGKMARGANWFEERARLELECRKMEKGARGCLAVEL